MLLILDNFDSFTYNLVDYFYQLGHECEVIRNTTNPEEIEISKYTGIVITPGPEIPEKANHLMAIIAKYAGKIPTLGICLGHQALALHYGATLHKSIPVHGKLSNVLLDKTDSWFQGFPKEIKVIRYHSWSVKELPGDLMPLAFTEDHILMAFRHCALPVYGIQFHPESILTEKGIYILKNWLRINNF
jgi:anthranilate synthase/aminodeoxychorismate synthase-like glutamine amidotransferase